jgi:hypothetical protein
VAEVEHGIACLGRCEEDVRAIDHLTNQAVKFSTSEEKIVRRNSIPMTDLFYLVLGALFLGWGIYQRDIFAKLLGGAFLVFGGYGLVRALMDRERRPKN